MKSHLSVFLLTLMLSACGGKSSGSSNVRLVELDDRNLDSSLAERISGVTFLPLETDATTQFRNVDKIVFENDLIYIGDYASGKILTFGMDGRSRFVLDRQGRGPGEYLRIQNFAVNEQDLFVLDNMQGRIFVYDCRSGAFRYNVGAPVVAWDMECFKDGSFIFAFAPMERGVLKKTQPRCRTFIVDKKWKIKEKMFAYAEGEFDLLGFPNARYLSTYGDKVLQGSFEENGYHLFSKEDGSFLETVKFSFSNGIPNRRKLDRSVLDHFTYITSSPLMCGDYIAFEVGTDEFIDWRIHDFCTKRSFTNSRRDARNFVFDLIGSYEDSFVGFLQDGYYYSSLTSAGFSRADSATEAAILRDEPALIFYHMK